MNQKSLKAIFSLQSKLLDFEGLNNQMKLKLFDSLIKPILTYMGLKFGLQTIR